MSSHATLDEAKSAAAELKHIEDEIAKVHSALERTGAGVTEPLVDQEGYPRSDVDVHAARIDRNKLARLRTDRALAAKKVESLLHQVHAESPTGGTNSSGTGAPNQATERQPFATLNDVAPGSPAAVAGLANGDKLLLFGDADASTVDGLGTIGSITRANVGKPVRVMVKRGDKTKLLRLVPQEWSGRGLLGCALLPI
eukprot:m.18830 g.18830  ORF g.18830 m.18830 type:complete len:198 (+) comp3630_c0_seq1:111-704(+)